VEICSIHPPPFAKFYRQSRYLLHREKKGKVTFIAVLAAEGGGEVGAILNDSKSAPILLAKLKLIHFIF
jgi:hypothetical protein